MPPAYVIWSQLTENSTNRIARYISFYTNITTSIKIMKHCCLYKNLPQLNKDLPSFENRKLNLELYAKDWDLAKKDFTKFLLLDLAILILTFALSTSLLLILLMVLFSLTSTRFADERSTSVILSIEINRAAIPLTNISLY